MYVSDKVKKIFNERLETAMKYIQESSIEYRIVGIFGSYARNDYKAVSDIDIVIVCDELPERYLCANLRCLLEDIKVDCTVMSMQRYEEEDSRFMTNLRRDLKIIERN